MLLQNIQVNVEQTIESEEEGELVKEESNLENESG